VAQRRRRVFVVASARTDFDPAQVLFEFEGVRRDIAPSREKGQEPSATIAARFGISRNNHEEVVTTNSHVAGTLAANTGGLTRPAGNANELDFCVAQPIAFEPGKLKRLDYGDAEPGLSPTLRADAGDNQLAVAQPIPLDLRNSGRDPEKYDAINRQGVGVGEPGGLAHTVTSAFVHGVAQGMAVRRLTPRECERLQGFPDDYTAIPKAADGPRYKALGNSMAVPVMAWIGKRIANALA